MLDLLRAKYANRNLALVIPVGPPALRFALLHRAAIVPGVPVVFVAACEAVLADLPLPPDVTGIWMVSPISPPAHASQSTPISHTSAASS
jgi:hypothetical protein